MEHDEINTRWEDLYVGHGTRLGRWSDRVLETETTVSSNGWQWIVTPDTSSYGVGIDPATRPVVNQNTDVNKLL